MGARDSRPTQSGSGSNEPQPGYCVSSRPPQSGSGSNERWSGCRLPSRPSQSDSGSRDRRPGFCLSSRPPQSGSGSNDRRPCVSSRSRQGGSGRNDGLPTSSPFASNSAVEADIGQAVLCVPPDFLDFRNVEDETLDVYLVIGFKAGSTDHVHTGVVLGAPGQQILCSWDPDTWWGAIIHMVNDNSSPPQPVCELDVKNSIGDFDQIVTSPIQGEVYAHFKVGDVSPTDRDLTMPLDKAIQDDLSRRFMVAIADSDVGVATNCVAFTIRILDALGTHVSENQIAEKVSLNSDVNDSSCRELCKVWGHYQSLICGVSDVARHVAVCQSVFRREQTALVAIGHSSLVSDENSTTIPCGSKLVTYPPPGAVMLVADAEAAVFWMLEHRSVPNQVGLHNARDNTQISPRFMITGDDKLWSVGLWKVVPGEVVVQVSSFGNADSRDVETLFKDMHRHGCDYVVLMGCKNNSEATPSSSLTVKDRIVPPPFASEYHSHQAVELKDGDGTTAMDLVQMLYQLLPNGPDRAAQMKPHPHGLPYIAFVPTSDVPELYHSYKHPEFRAALARVKSNSSRRPRLMFPPFQLP